MNLIVLNVEIRVETINNTLPNQSKPIVPTLSPISL